MGFAIQCFTPKVLNRKAQGCDAVATLGDDHTIDLPRRGCIQETDDASMVEREKKIREDMFKYLGGICNGQNCPVIRVGGVADHVHILCRLGKTNDISDLLHELKRQSSIWVKTQGHSLSDFYWQSGYGAFSVSPGHVEGLITYIDNQEEHHKTISFQDEYRGLLTKYGIAWDERYVWD